MAKITTAVLLKMKQQADKISMLTAYDASFAKLFAEQGVDVLLIGDSLGTVLQGHSDTLPVTVADIAYHTKSVRAGAPALALEAAGAQLLVLECIPTPLAKRITDALSIPVIGIGAGNVTDGQVLVMHDLLGISSGYIPKFSKNYLAQTGEIRSAIAAYVSEVKSQVFPGTEHSFN